MKKLMILGLLVVSMLMITGCGTNIGSNDSTDPNDSTNSNGSIVLPGKDRIWFYQNFYTTDETISFVHELYSSSSNGDFSIGISDFESKNRFKECSIKFSGHIDSNFGNDLDIFNSVYDEFRIDFIYSISENNNNEFDDKLITYKFEEFSDKKIFHFYMIMI